MKKTHSFHIPVMGIGFTIDTPLKVAQYGMDSVISLVDDILLERLRKMYSEKFEIPYKEITNKVDDFRAKRITSYLNMMNDVASQKFESLKNSTLEKSGELKNYISMKNKPTLIFGILIAVLIFYTELSGFVGIWNHDRDLSVSRLQISTSAAAEIIAEKQKPLNRDCSINFYQKR